MKRITWLDDLKGFAIILIVAGHVVATLGNMTTGSAQSLMQVVFGVIYSFHIPLFFVIAGMTFSAKDRFGLFVKKKFLRLMLPYYIWGFASAMIYIVMGQGVAADMQAVSTTTSFADKTLHGAWWTPIVSILHAGTWPDGRGFCFNGVLWFLPVIFATEIVYYWIARFCRNCTQIFCVFALLACVLILFYPLVDGINVFGFSIRYCPFSFMRLIKYLPFVAIGHWFSCRFLRGDFGNAKVDKTFLSIGVVLLMFFCLSYFFPIARANSCFWVKWMVWALSEIAVLMICAKFRVLRWFGFLSPMTLGIMLFHKFPLVLMQIALGRSGVLRADFCCQYPSAMIMVVMILLTITLSLLCYFVSRMISFHMPWALGNARGC